MTNRTEELHKMKELLKDIKTDANNTSDNMSDFLFSLYKYFPYYEGDIQLPNSYYDEIELPTHVVDMISTLNNDDLNEGLKYFLMNKNRLLRTKHSHEHEIFEEISKDNDKRYKLFLHTNVDDLVRYEGLAGAIITNHQYPENELLKRYYPNLNIILFELYAIYLYSIRTNRKDIASILEQERYKKISSLVWDMHKTDLLASTRFFINFKKTNKQLNKDHCSGEINNTQFLKYFYNSLVIGKINTYSLSLLLRDLAIKDPYSFGNILKELETTDNTNLEEVLNHLGINYITNPDILSGLGINPKTIVDGGNQRKKAM
jgi:hypothetical protein